MMDFGLLLQLFFLFIKIGFLSFGGGYSMMPVIEHEVLARNWMNPQSFSDMIALSGMSPGPIAANTAVMVGYQVAGLPGAIISVLGIVLPSLLLVVLVGMLLTKYRHHPWLEAAFTGLRPVVIAFVFYAAYRFAQSSHVFQAAPFHLVSFIAIFLGAFIALRKFKTHPLLIIIFSGLVGVALYT
ncbi:chromate transporter [Paenibacillus koleovorans]|uniref:chromate transporter n=1 Tax=Paenibacillus koleovorans TaxID=121608 RepID=UPI001FE56F4A|nr:chromate transporter [Paenibacillus koleovorans]